MWRKHSRWFGWIAFQQFPINSKCMHALELKYVHRIYNQKKGNQAAVGCVWALDNLNFVLVSALRSMIQTSIYFKAEWKFLVNLLDSENVQNLGKWTRMSVVHQHQQLYCAKFPIGFIRITHSTGRILIQFSRLDVSFQSFARIVGGFVYRNKSDFG